MAKIPDRNWYKDVPDGVAPIPVAIVGRPNVGKSTLYNRLISGTRKGKAPVDRRAIVSPQAGTTRDRKDALAVFGGLLVRLIDTGGLEAAAQTDDSPLLTSMREQVLRAIAEAEAVLFLIDAREGVTPVDLEIAKMLLEGLDTAAIYRDRLGLGPPRDSVPIILVANKAEGAFIGPYLNDCYELGLGDPVLVSAKHSEGLDDLYDRLCVEVGHLQGSDEDGEEIESDEAESAEEEESEDLEEDEEEGEEQGFADGAADGPSPTLPWSPTMPLSEIQKGGLRWYFGHSGNPFQHLSPAVRESVLANLSRSGRPSEPVPGSLPAEDAVPMHWLGAKQRSLPTKEIRDYVLNARRAEDLQRPLRLAVVGGPSAGKSSVINALLQEERVVVDEADGTTMDSIVSDWSFKGQPVKLIDTCGILKGFHYPGSFTENLEPGMGTRKAIRQSHVCILCIDVQRSRKMTYYRCPSHFELRLAKFISEEGKAVVIAVNKWDLIAEDEQPKYRDEILKRIADRLPDLKGVPVVFTSAKYNLNLSTLMLRAHTLYKRWSARLPTGKLNSWLHAWMIRWPPPWRHGQKCTVKYMTQTRTRPPTFVLWTNTTADEMPRHYVRQIQNHMRQEFRIQGVPIRFVLRSTLMPKPRRKLSKKDILRWKRVGPKQAEAVMDLNSKKMLRKRPVRQTE